MCNSLCMQGWDFCFQGEEGLKKTLRKHVPLLSHWYCTRKTEKEVAVNKVCTLEHVAAF